MSILEVRDVSFSFGDKDLYKDVNFDLNSGEHMGLVGSNGTGKSTLLRLLQGELVPDSGTIVWQKQATIGYIDQYSQIQGKISILEYLHSAFEALYAAENRMLELYGACDEAKLLQAANLQEWLEREGFYDIEFRIQQVAEGLGLVSIGLDRSLDSLSSGQRTKTLLAKLLLQVPSVLLLDEPTNFLDVEHITWLTGYLKDFSGAYIVVSHDFEFLEKVTNCILNVEFQRIFKYHGCYTDFVRQAEERKKQQRLLYEAQQKQIEKLEKYIDSHRYRASTAKMAQSRIKTLEKMEKIEPPDVEPEPRIHFQYHPTEAVRMLQTEALQIGYEYPLLPPLTFTLQNEKLALVGFNGIGKSTLLKTLMGQIPMLGGRFFFLNQARIGYYEQDLAWSNTLMTPLEILSQHYPGTDLKKLRGALARCGIRAKHVLRPIKDLSGGEQSKVKLCLLTMSPYNVLLLDEPTNHLDDKAKASLAGAIREFPGAVILVCHEEAFYRQCTDRVFRIGE